MTTKLDLAKLMLIRITKDPTLEKYLKVTEGADDLRAIPLANLFFHLEQYYNDATTVKSVLTFLTEDLGINKRHCILVIAIEDMALYRIVASMVAESTEGYYVGRAHSLEEARTLINYFNMNNWACGLIVEEQMSDGSCIPLIQKCTPLPICVLVNGSSLGHYVKLLGEGASVIVDIASQPKTFEKHLRNALIDMFMGGIG